MTSKLLFRYIFCSHNDPQLRVAKGGGVRDIFDKDAVSLTMPNKRNESQNP